MLVMERLWEAEKEKLNLNLVSLKVELTSLKSLNERLSQRYRHLSKQLGKPFNRSFTKSRFVSLRKKRNSTQLDPMDLLDISRVSAGISATYEELHTKG